MSNHCQHVLTYGHALGERVAGEAGWAGTDGVVVLGSALSTHTACVGTRVGAALVDTRTVQRTLGADDTLGSARWW